MNEQVLRKLSYGVYVVSSYDETKPTGCIANSIIQVSYDTVAISLNHNNYTNQCVKNSKRFAISILGENCNDNIIPTFGFQSSRDVNKFANFENTDICGIKVLNNAIGYICCEVIGTLETETHTIFLGKILDGDVLNEDEPMTYAYYHKVKKGKSPKNAPTYIAEKEEVSSDIAYKCSICGFIYNGDITKEPDTYICPICKQAKSVFVKI